MEGELQWKAIEERNLAIKWGEFADSPTSLEGDWPVVSSAAAWPDLEVGIKFSVEVHSDVEDLSRGNSACRSLMIIGCFFVSNFTQPPMSLRRRYFPWKLFPL
jgi:hypothetical protein